MANVFTVHFINTNGQNIPDVDCVIIDTATGSRSGEAVSNASGIATFSTTSASVYLIAVSNSYTFTPRTITVAEGAQFTLVGSSITLKSSDNPEFCKVQGNITDLSGSKALWEFTINGLYGVGSYGNTLSTNYLTVSSKDGYVEFDLERGQGYLVSNLPYVDTYVIYAPDLPYARLVDVMIPRAISIQTSADSLNLSENAVGTLTVTSTLSDGRSGLDLSADYIEVTSSDEDVAQAHIRSNGELVIASKNAGTCSLFLRTEKANEDFPAMSTQTLLKTLDITVG